MSEFPEFVGLDMFICFKIQGVSKVASPVPGISWDYQLYKLYQVHLGEPGNWCWLGVTWDNLASLESPGNPVRWSHSQVAPAPDPIFLMHRQQILHNFHRQSNRLHQRVPTIPLPQPHHLPRVILPVKLVNHPHKPAETKISATRVVHPAPIPTQTQVQLQRAVANRQSQHQLQLSFAPPSINAEGAPITTIFVLLIVWEDGVDEGI
ncbi:hypothetical protein PM082_018503 [Marasmius tenuissimus]|nr:hypothetical protein PM082_018503 [Marasmius tenuissimus]